MKYRTRFRKYDFNKIYICLILVLVCFIGIGYSIIQSKPKLSGTAKIAAYIPMAFANQTKTSSPSTSEQNISITDATGGSGRFIYTEKSEKNSSNVDTSYFTINSKNIVVAPNTPKDTYTYVITATDIRNNQTIDATYTIRIKNDFANDNWATIAANIQSNPNSYDVGDTKDVPITGLGTYTVRIANTNTTSECSNSSFSQTACGVVIEFVDIIEYRRMNMYNGVTPETNGIGNRGGWKYSDMRAYLNNGIYLPDDSTNRVDYTSSGLFTKLPTALQNVIIDTRVISGYGCLGEVNWMNNLCDNPDNNGNNFETTDKLYLLSNHEVWEDIDGNTTAGPDYQDSAYNNTRQLDYYKNLEVTTSNFSGASRGISGDYWWLRSASYNYYFSFNRVDSGYWSLPNADVPGGVSPAFRIGLTN